MACYMKERTGVEVLDNKLQYASGTPVPHKPPTPPTPRKRKSMPIYMMLRKNY